MTDKLDGTAVTTPNPLESGSGEALAAPFPEPTPISTNPSRNSKVRPGDRIFRGLAEGSGVLIVVIIAAIGFFLLWRAIPALARNEENFFLYSGTWNTSDTSAMSFGILDLLQVTVFVSLFALVIAMPIALGIAIYLTNYAPKRVSGPLAYMVDLLAAVPSIIYGVWGLYVLAPAIKPAAVWLNENLSWVFLFATGNASVAGGGTIFTAGIVLAVMILPIITAGIVLAVMILPIITAVTREVFVQTPRGQIEAALALGATRWEVVRTTVLPFGMSGYISGAMLGLGRALGETIALLIILRGTQAAFNWSLFDAGYTFASLIASAASEFNDQYKAGAYIAAGLVLFILTFVVNTLARAAVAGKDRSAS
ncbi:PstC family ABC transporter permease [Mycolicibacterium iranicum]|uniref:PstC family ABC transporter permease n=1 Tax=Mycolicibacterium iranicum TaxID=912594 RepID=UPI00046543D0|nr:phosphate ABC transporter permease subunit PstC [Mycolicibacterium iranicum]